MKSYDDEPGLEKELKCYDVKWTEIHYTSVDAYDFDDAVEKAYEHSYHEPEQTEVRRVLDECREAD